jgi:precorrin-2 dehydrogenase/sirohydrochlorin ferrochelatase
MKKFAYPVFLSLTAKPCLVVGGGVVAERKVLKLLVAEAGVTVVALKSSKKITQLAEAGRLVLKKRAFLPSDLNNVFLCIVATGDTKLNKEIAALAQAQNILVNVVDTPAASNFIVPAVVTQDFLSLAISTNGLFPGLAKKLRQQLEKQFGPEYGAYLKLIAAVRSKILQEAYPQKVKAKLLKQLLQLPLLDEIKAGKKPSLDAVRSRLH